MRIHREVHPGDGPPLLLVHGMLAGPALWRPNLAALSTVARPVVVELWGHGRSPAPDDPASYHPDAYVRAFEEIREDLGAPRWAACGQSFGGALTLRYALDHPERVTAHVFTNSVSGLGDEAWIADMREAGPATAASLERGGRAALERLPIHPRHARRLPDDVRAALLEDSERLDPGGVARHFLHAVPAISVRDRVGDNRVPTLLVCGERERAFAPCREYVERTMPHLEVAGCDAGHAVNLEASEAFNDAATRFLRRFR